VSVKQRGKSKTWYYYFRLNSVRYRRAIPEARTKYQAQQAEAAARDSIFEGKYNRRSSTTTFRQFVESEFLPWAKDNKRSWRNDVSRAKPLIEFFGKQRLSEVTRFLIEQFKKQRRGGLSMRGDSLSNSSVNRELELLSRIFSFAIERGEIDSNPFKGVKKLPMNNLLTRYLTEDEERRLMAVLTNRRAHLLPIVLIALHTGMRRGEILSLRWEQVDFVRESIYLLHTKSGKPRTVPMNAVVKDAMSEVRKDAGGFEYVFLNPRTGKPLTDIKNAFNAALKEAGIEGLRFHDLRHTAGTRMADANAPITAIAEILGHRDIHTTMRYAHATDEGKRRAVKSLEGVVPNLATKSNSSPLKAAVTC